MQAACLFGASWPATVRWTASNEHAWSCSAHWLTGSATPRIAPFFGLEGNEPASIAPDTVEVSVGGIRSHKLINIAGTRAIAFDEAHDLVFNREQM